MELLITLVLSTALAVDADMDGHEPPFDCDDANALVHPDVPSDDCDLIDNDCDQQIDEDPPLWFLDQDYDGFGAGAPVGVCPWQMLPPSGGARWTPRGGDCNDAVASVHPEMQELCDNRDNDCNGLVDEDIPVRTLWPDKDGDGFGTSDDVSIQAACPPVGFSPYDDDCDDDDADVHPLHGPTYLGHVPLLGVMQEFSEADRNPAFVGDGIDQDCDGVDLCYWDTDADGFGGLALVPGGSLDCDAGSMLTSSTSGDCDDRDASAFPGGHESVGDGVDGDCDGRERCYEDRDGDSYGNDFSFYDDNNLDCDDGSAPTSSRGGDCNDDPARGGAAASIVSVEECDGIDNNCDGLIDEVTSPDANEYFLDEDGDGFGVATIIIRACEAPGGGPPLGYAERAGDCDDAEPRVFPGAPELCDGLDNNCRSGVDEEGGVITWLEDADRDGYGDPAVVSEGCGHPPGSWVTAGGELDRCPDDPRGPCSGCGCASGGNPGWIWWGGFVWLLRRGRRDRRPTSC